MNTLFNIFSLICRHPLNRGKRLRSLLRFLRWQIGSRLVPGAVAVPFVDDTRLLVLPGMTGATGSIYHGLHEFEDMGLVLHALRPGDLFVDIGANVGSYTILAAGACGAGVLAVEANPSAFVHLNDNVRLNDLQDLVQTRNVAAGASPGVLEFSTDLDVLNHVISETDSAELPRTQVPVETLDSLLAGDAAFLIKIDTEGYETEVIRGAAATLNNSALVAVVMELNGSGERYGFDETKLHGLMLENGFRPFRYDPMDRAITPLEIANKNLLAGNTLYIRDLETLTERVRSAPRHIVNGVSL